MNDKDIIKSYTDLKQSKKLAKILPIESADMRYGYIAPYEFSDRMYDGGYDDVPYLKDFIKKNSNFSEDEYDGEFPCWSLAALRACLPSGINIDGILYVFESHNTFDNKWVYEYKFEDISAPLYSKSSNEIDACVELIIKLNEQKLI